MIFLIANNQYVNHVNVNPTWPVGASLQSGLSGGCNPQIAVPVSIDVLVSAPNVNDGISGSERQDTTVKFNAFAVYNTEDTGNKYHLYVDKNVIYQNFRSYAMVLSNPDIEETQTDKFYRSGALRIYPIEQGNVAVHDTDGTVDWVERTVLP